MRTSRLALAVAVVLWASAFPAIRVGLDGLGVAGLSVLRVATAALVLGLVAPVLRVRLPKARDLPLIAVCGASGMSGYPLLLNWGEVHVPAGTASLLVASAPVFSVLLGTAFLGERPRGRTVLGSVVALAGAAVIAMAGGPAHVSASALVVLAAAVVQGVYHAASKPLLRRYTSVEVACYAIWAGVVFLLPWVPATLRVVGHAPGGALAAAGYLGLLPSARVRRLGLRRGPAAVGGVHGVAVPGAAGRGAGRVHLARRDAERGRPGRRVDQHHWRGADQPGRQIQFRCAASTPAWKRLRAPSRAISRATTRRYVRGVRPTARAAAVSVAPLANWCSTSRTTPSRAPRTMRSPDCGQSSSSKFIHFTIMPANVRSFVISAPCE